MIRPQGEPIDDLFPARLISPGAESAARDLVGRMNRRHLERHAGEDVLAARIRGYEMAARMQTSVPLVTDLVGEQAETLALYGVDRPETTDFGRACLIAAPADRTGRAVRPAFVRRHIRQPEAQLGRARRYEGKPRAGGLAH